MTASDPRARLRIGVGAAVVLVVVALGVGVAAAALTDAGDTREITPATPVPTASAVARTVVVHVLGAVQSPGLYTLDDGARVVDAIAAAGGLTAHADPAAVNLARFLTDGEQLVVLEEGEAPPPGVAGAPGGGPGGTTAGGLVNLNTADQATLETLPRVGPALAQRILAWRDDNGGFTSVDDLRGVSGIGEKTFAQLEPLVTV
ncbi:helix-hairpin-helix domain-containing protein [Galbitalea sp. SE-J8]|uniref:helix-hairpin-helix domain-containing protein n=1 Tax=Galbitalea sp. SE-J8 TaxID=3054952 RepID=UPI00259D0754|nr:helix-hairpin-helix domain-containing protein [Galbitalea sp. SE-J8]MDM4761803.1 helix-hairpin-helix domain-containing protein [Galbitalea sp. SE-J8]